MDKIEDLKPIRVYDFGLIPRYLIEDVKESGGYDLNIDTLIMMGSKILAMPNQFLYVFADSDHVIQGYTWFTANVLSESLDVTHIAMTEDYRGGSQYMKLIVPLTRKIRKKLNFDTTRWFATRPDIYEQLGFENTGIVIMKDSNLPEEEILKKLEEYNNG